MAEHRSVASWLPRSAGGALLLAGGGAGLWLLGSQSAPASADEPSLPSAPGTLATQLLAPLGELAPPVVDQVVAPVSERLAVPVASDVVAPVVAQVVGPVVQDVAVPVVADVAPVVAVAVAEPAAPVATTEHVSDQDAPPIAVSTPADLGTPPVVEIEQPVTAPDLAPVTGPRTPSATRITTAPVVEPATPAAPAPGPVEPVGPVGPPSAVPPPSASSGSCSADQTPADVATAPPALTVPGRCTATDAGLGATGRSAFDPSFSPD